MDERSRRRVLRGAALLVAAAALGAEPPRLRDAPDGEGTRRMALRLATIADSANPWSNPYLSEQRSRILQRLPLPADATARVRQRYELAQELVRAGETERGLDVLARLSEEVGDAVRPLRALALLRLAEQKNCLARHSADSCLLPIRDAGIHVERQPARDAAVEYRALVERTPDDLGSRWRLNLASMAAGDYPEGVPEAWRLPARVFESDHDVGRFRDVAGPAGLAAVGLAGGAIVEDFDGDGDYDVMVSSSGLRDPLRYFRNRADGTFEERTREARLDGLAGGLNLVHADYDNDGDADVLVLRGAWLGVPPATDGGRHPNSLLRNDGNGVFVDVTERAGMLSFHPTQTAAWADYDGDGRLDLFVGNESFQRELHPCQLYHNEGDGTFVDVAAAVGVDAIGLVKGVAWGDYDDDGRPDLYLSRLGAANLLFHNEGPREDGGWAFRETAAAAGVAEPLASFPTWFWDYDNDGRLDLFVSGYGTGMGDLAADVLADYLGLPTRAERPRLYHNEGDGTFADVTREAGLHHVLFTMGCNFGDLDNDGFLDVYLGTGDPDLRALVPNRMFRNAEGRRFQDVTASGGFGHLQKGHGIAFADLDGDGDQDVYAAFGGFYSGDVYPNALFENPGHGNRAIRLQLEGVVSNRSAIGARVVVAVSTAQGPREVHTVVGGGGSFGGSPMRREIGLGAALGVTSVTVRWPGGGRVQRFTGLEPDRAYALREGDERPRPLDLPRFVFRRGSAGERSGHGHPPR